MTTITNTNNFIQTEIQQSIATKQLLLENQDSLTLIDSIIQVCIECYQRGGKTLFAGNGGSASDAQHLAAELVNRLSFNRPALASIALTTDTSILTSVVNDLGLDYLFSRQVEAMARAGDVFFAISTSGNSANVIAAIEQAKTMDVIVIGLTGKTGGKMAELCDYCIKVPSTDTPRIQESHILIGHIICTAIEELLFAEFR